MSSLNLRVSLSGPFRSNSHHVHTATNGNVIEICCAPPPRTVQPRLVIYLSFSAMSRTAHRLFSSSLRSSSRLSLNTAAACSPRPALTQRMMSSESHTSHGGASGDRLWMVCLAFSVGVKLLKHISPCRLGPRWCLVLW